MFKAHLFLFFVFTGYASAQFPSLPKFKAALGPLEFSLGKEDRESITLDPENKQVSKNINDTYTVVCKSSDGSEDVEWRDPADYKIDENYPGLILGTGVSTEKLPNNNGLRLTIAKITPFHSGTYVCSSPNAKESFTLDVMQELTDAVQYAEESEKHSNNSTDCVCPSLNQNEQSVTDKPEQVDNPTLLKIWERQSEIMEMQQKTWEQVKKISDTLFAVQYGRRVVEIENNQ